MKREGRGKCKDRWNEDKKQREKEGEEGGRG